MRNPSRLIYVFYYCEFIIENSLFGAGSDEINTTKVLIEQIVVVGQTNRTEGDRLWYFAHPRVFKTKQYCSKQNL